MNTARRNNTREAKDKELIRCEMELRELWKIQRHAPKHKLDEPRFAGYKKFFVLRDDVARRKDAQTFHEILNLVNDCIISKNEHFVTRERIPGTNKYIERIRTPELRGITTQRWEKLNLPKHIKKWFRLSGRWIKHPYGNFVYEQKRWHFDLPWMFVHKTEPHYITEIPTIYPEIEAKEDEIRKRMQGLGGWHRLAHLKGQRHHCRDEWGLSILKHNELNKLNLQEIKEWKDDHQRHIE